MNTWRSLAIPPLKVSGSWIPLCFLWWRSLGCWVKTITKEHRSRFSQSIGGLWFDDKSGSEGGARTVLGLTAPVNSISSLISSIGSCEAQSWFHAWIAIKEHSTGVEDSLQEGPECKPSQWIQQSVLGSGRGEILGRLDMGPISSLVLLSSQMN